MFFRRNVRSQTGNCGQALCRADFAASRRCHRFAAGNSVTNTKSSTTQNAAAMSTHTVSRPALAAAKETKVVEGRRALERVLEAKSGRGSDMVFVMAGRVPIGRGAIFCWFTEGEDHPVVPPRYSSSRDFSPKARIDMRIFTHFSEFRDRLGKAISGQIYNLPSV